MKPSRSTRGSETQADYAEACNNLGTILGSQGRLDEAIAEFREALRLNPNMAQAHLNLGNVLSDRGQVDEAIAHYQRALEIQPNLAEAHYSLGNVLAGRAQLDEAIAEYRKALEIKPAFADARHNLEVVRDQRTRIRRFLPKLRESLRLRPKDVTLLNDTAWLLATAPSASVRNGAEASRVGPAAVELSDAKRAEILGTLAAAYAEAGRFAEAVQTARKAADLATQQNSRPWPNPSGPRFALRSRDTFSRFAAVLACQDLDSTLTFDRHAGILACDTLPANP